MRQRRRIRGLKAERADVILAGAVVIEELMALGGYEVLTVCDEGVRHGLLDPGDLPAGVDRVNSEAFVNRELSWLEFNRRVLEEAEDPTVPLLERVKFLAIVSSNLDEFFMVRVAGLKRRIREGDGTAGPDGLSPGQTLAAVAERARRLSDEQHRCFLDQLEPLLAAEGIRLLDPTEITPEQEKFLDDYFQRTLLPVVTPLAIDPGHPFPASRQPLAVPDRLAHARDAVAAAARASWRSCTSRRRSCRASSQLPAPPGEHAFILLEDVIRLYLPRIYHGYTVAVMSRDPRDPRRGSHGAAGRDEDLLTAIEESLRDRRMGTAVRLQYDADLPPTILATIVDELELQPEDLYEARGFIAFADLFQLYAAVDLPRLKDRPLAPQPVRRVRGGARSLGRDPRRRRPGASPLPLVRRGDPLRPRRRRRPEGAGDQDDALPREPGLADRPGAHAWPPSAGKEVAVLVELQARFDEEANIRWARALEAVGAHVVYGLVGYKTHCKACLVVRQEADGIRRYCHLATGNYNVRTAGVYGDLGLFTCRESFGEDLTELFNLLTGYTRPRRFNHLVVAPTDLRDGLVMRIRREAEHARAGRPRADRRQGEQPRRPDPDRGALSRRAAPASRSTSSSGGSAVSVPACPGCPTAFARSRSSIAFSSTRACSTSRTTMPPNTGSPLRTGCRATSTGGSRSRFRSWSRRFARELAAILDVQLGDTVKARLIRPDGTSQRISASPGAPLAGTALGARPSHSAPRPSPCGPLPVEFHASVINS